MKIKSTVLSATAIALMLSACTTYTAKQPYRGTQGEDLLISGAMINGKLTIYINGMPVINDTILNFGKPFHGAYGKQNVTALCQKRTHMFSVESECDVFIDNKFSANLYLR